MDHERALENLRVQFEVWRDIDSGYHWQVSPKGKFGPLLGGQPQKAVVALSWPLSWLPEGLQERFPGAKPYRGKRKAGEQAETVSPWAQRMERAHLRKWQKATLLLSNSATVEELLTIARKWQLDKHLYWVDPTSFWFAEGCLGFVCWETFLLWLSAKYVDKCGYREGSVLPITRFGREVTSFTRQHGLSALWERSIKGLLLTGLLYVPYEDCRIIVQQDGDTPRVFFEVFPETTRQDLVDKWVGNAPLLERFFPTRPKRRRAREQLTRDLATKAALARGTTLDQLAIDKYDTQTYEEDQRVIEALRKGVTRLNRAQAGIFEAAAEAELPDWLRQQQEVSWRDEKEWWF